MNNLFLLFYCLKPRSQARILIYRNWSIPEMDLEVSSVMRPKIQQRNKSICKPLISFRAFSLDKTCHVVRDRTTVITI